jgi:DNA polymerase-3 subunit epsilon
MATLFFDTETSDLPDRYSGPGRHQPHIVQLAAMLVDGQAERILATLIRPDGWRIHPDAQALHRISLERAAAEGIAIAEAVAKFDELLQQADLAVAHNVNFDCLLIDSEYLRVGRRAAWPKTFCTMESCTNILRLPGVRGKYKWPRLEEVYYYFFGRPLTKAHDALVDVKACREIFDAMVKRGLASADSP